VAATVWKGYLSFGLVSFPVRLFAAARPDTIHFHLLHRKDFSRVKEVWFCAKEGKQIERSEMVKGYEASKGEYVVVDDEELKQIEPVTASTMDVVQFVRENEVDPLYFERSYYVGAEGKLTKPYALFVHALRDSQFHAIAKLSMHGREHVVLIRPMGDGLLLHTLFYADELQKGNKQGETTKVDRKELDLAKNLIKQLAAPFEPESFHDEYRANVERLIKEKQNSETITTVKKPRKAEVIDLMEALKRSLDASKSSHVKTKASKRRKVA
jgi:DNA end-binding protein Ku